MLDVQSQVSNFIFSLSFHTLIVALSLEAGGDPTLAISGRVSPASELDCYHISYGPVCVSCIHFYFYFTVSLIHTVHSQGALSSQAQEGSPGIPEA